MKRLILSLFILIFPLSGFSWQQNFNNAKKQLVKIYKQHPEQKEFYCGCDFIFTGKKGIVDLARCGYQVRKNRIRAERIEWEHVMTAHQFGHQLGCWQQGGRRQCKNDPTFQKMEGDMHNLQPAVGEINADRSNYRYSLFSQSYHQYGQCQAVTDFKNRQFQPREAVRGIIARTYLYMSNRYGILLSQQERKLMQAWNTMFPPSNWECQRNRKIQQIQGNDNYFISSQCHSRFRSQG